MNEQQQPGPVRAACLDAHVWSSPARVGDACACGARVIRQTVETGTWNGLSVTSWETEPAAGHEQAGDVGT